MGWMDDTYAEAIAGRIPAGAKLRRDTRAQVVETPAKPIIRQSRKGPNKTELRFENEKLKPWQSEGRIVGYQFEAITLKLANGVRYTPDYVAYGIGAIRVYEVKGGFIREDAKIKLKFAAQQFHFFEFYLAQYEKGEWFIDRVLP